MLAPNLAALQQRYPNINWHALVHSTPFPPHFVLQAARNGSPTLIINHQALHSLYHPEKEATQQLAHINPTADGFIIVGLGLGYLAQALQNRHPDKPLIIVEPSLELFLFVLTHCDLSSLLLAPSVVLLVQQPTAHLINTCQTLSLKQAQTLIHRPLEQLYSALYTPITEALAQYQLQKKTNHDTVKKYGDLWMRHLVQNLPLWPSSQSVRNLFNQFTNCPALIVAAGPSLQSILPHLPHLAQRVLIICVDTAVRFVQRTGVTPDIIVAIDSQYWNSRHFDYCSLRTSLLVAEPSLHPAILRRCPAAQRYLISSLFPFGSALEQAITPFGSLRSGGSVATTAWDLARALGCPTLWFAGLDLAYPAGETHAEGALFEEWALAKAHRFNSAQNAFLQLMHPQQLTTTGVSGEPVKTDIRMNIYREWLESVAHEATACNLSHGAAIRGIPSASIETLLASPIIRPQLAQKLAELRQPLSNKEIASRTDALATTVNHFMNALTELRQLAEEGQALTHQLMQNPHNRQQVKALALIDKALHANEAKQSLNFLFDPIFNEFLAELATQPTQTLPTSLALYAKIAELAHHYHQMFMAYKSKA